MNNDHTEKDSLGELGMHKQSRPPRHRAASTPNPSALDSLDIPATSSAAMAAAVAAAAAAQASGKSPLMQMSPSMQSPHTLWNQNSIWKDRTSIPISEAQQLLAMAAVAKGKIESDS
jgi:hypothetical protein